MRPSSISGLRRRLFPTVRNIYTSVLQVLKHTHTPKIATDIFLKLGTMTLLNVFNFQRLTLQKFLVFTAQIVGRHGSISIVKLGNLVSI